MNGFIKHKGSFGPGTQFNNGNYWRSCWFPVILFICSFPAIARAQNNELDFFIGTWNFKVWFSNDTTKQHDIIALWTLEKGLDSAMCLLGNVKMNGTNFTREFITLSPDDEKQYTRTIITNDGSYVQLTSYGWQTDKFSWVGIQKQEEKTIQLREDIVRLSDNQFKAVFFRFIDGKWIQTQTELLERIQTSQKQG